MAITVDETSRGWAEKGRFAFKIKNHQLVEHLSIGEPVGQIIFYVGTNATDKGQKQDDGATIESKRAAIKDKLTAAGIETHPNYTGYLVGSGVGGSEDERGNHRVDRPSQLGEKPFNRGIVALKNPKDLAAALIVLDIPEQEKIMARIGDHIIVAQERVDGDIKALADERRRAQADPFESFSSRVIDTSGRDKKGFVER